MTDFWQRWQKLDYFLFQQLVTLVVVQLAVRRAVKYVPEVGRLELNIDQVQCD